MSTKLTHEEFIEKLKPENKGFRVLGKYVNSATPIEIQCQFGHVWCASPRNLIHNNSGCPYCAGKKVWVGFNDLWTTRSDVAQLLKDPEDGYKYTKGSRNKVNFICPECGTVHNKSIEMVCRYGFVCQKCSDGISYPNKFGRALLEQLCGKGNFDCEWQPEWAKPYFYDNYFEYNDNKYILEMDGGFHYNNYKNSRISLEERRAADEIKNNLAIKNHIEIIRIDCCQSSCNYIKNNILNSKLTEIFDFTNINWELCDAQAQKNLIKEVCKLYNSGMHDLNNIKDILHISLWATREYVKIGANVGWCDYTVEKGRQIGVEKKMVPVNVVDSNNVIIHQFRGIHICAEEMTELYGMYFNTSNIIKSCKTHQTYKGFNFRYA